MAKVIDATGIQFRMLNRTKGPAMHSPRAQADKKLYQFTMKHRIEAQPGLTLRQEIVEGIWLEEIRNPKSEIRNKSEYQNPQAEKLLDEGFGFRISDFGFPSH